MRKKVKKKKAVKKKLPSKKKKPVKQTKSLFVVVKVSPKDKKMFARKAREYSKGNISTLVRNAVAAFAA